MLGIQNFLSNHMITIMKKGKFKCKIKLTKSIVWILLDLTMIDLSLNEDLSGADGQGLNQRIHNKHSWYAEMAERGQYNLQFDIVDDVLARVPFKN